MNSELFNENGAILPYSYPDLVPAGQREFIQQAFGYVNNSFSPCSNMKTSDATPGYYEDAEAVQ